MGPQRDRSLDSIRLSHGTVNRHAVYLGAADEGQAHGFVHMATQHPAQVVLSEPPYILAFDQQELITGEHSRFCSCQMWGHVSNENSTIAPLNQNGTDRPTWRRAASRCHAECKRERREKQETQSFHLRPPHLRASLDLLSVKSGSRR